MEKRNLIVKKVLKKCIRSKDCDFGLSHIDLYHHSSWECENVDCPFYIHDNDSGYYQYCMIGELIDNIRCLEKGGK